MSTSDQPSTSAAPVTSAGSSEWPPQSPLEHGGRYWAVYLAVAREGQDLDELAAAEARAAQAGYQANRGFCEDGAREALGLDPAVSYDAVSLFFATANDAQRFVDRYGPGVVGTAQVTALCLD